MLDLQAIQNVVEVELRQMVLDLQGAMVSSGANASGKTSASLQVESKRTQSAVISQITGGDGWKFVEQGRGPTRVKGNGVLRGLIRQWIMDKGIVPEDGISIDSLAFVITRAIHQRGTLLHFLGERRDIYTSVVNDEAIQRIQDKIGDVITLQVSSDIVKAFKNVST